MGNKQNMITISIDKDLKEKIDEYNANNKKSKIIISDICCLRLREKIELESKKYEIDKKIKLAPKELDNIINRLEIEKEEYEEEYYKKGKKIGWIWSQNQKYELLKYITEYAGSKHISFKDFQIYLALLEKNESSNIKYESKGFGKYQPEDFTLFIENLKERFSEKEANIIIKIFFDNLVSSSYVSNYDSEYGIIFWKSICKNSTWPPKHSFFWKGWIDGITIFFEKLQELI